MNQQLARIHRVLIVPYALVWALIGIPVVFGEAEGLHGGWLFAAIFAPAILAHSLAMVGARHGSTWGRYLSGFIGVVLLFGFPIGTFLGVYILRLIGSRWERPGVSGNARSAAAYPTSGTA